jgi:hypothetical protein
MALVALLPVVALYLLLATIFSLSVASGRGKLRLAFIIPFVFLVIHAAWGGSFLLGLMRSPQR